MADLVNAGNLTTEHGERAEHESSMCREAEDPKDPKGREEERPEESLRIVGGNCECNSQQQTTYGNNCNCVQPTIDLQPMYQPQVGCGCQAVNQAVNQTCQDTQWQTPAQWQDCGATVSIPASQCQYQSYAQPSQDYGCCSRVPSGHYMDYKGFQHSPKPNPIYVPTCGSVYTQESRQGLISASCGSFASIAPIAPMGCTATRTNSRIGFAGVKGSYERMRCQKRKEAQCCCKTRTPTRILSVERCCSPGVRTSPDRHCYRRSSAARSCDVRHHAHSHIHGHYHSRPKRSCAPPPCAPPPCAPPPCAPPPCAPPPCLPPPCAPTSCGRSSSRNRSRSCSRRSNRGCRASSVCSTPSDYMERNRYGTSCLKSPIVRTTSCYSGHCCGNSGHNRHRSPGCSSPYGAGGYSIRRSCRKTPSCLAMEPVMYFRPRSRSPSCNRPQSGSTRRSCRKPPPCSNETLMEQPVKSYRFSCPENRTMTLCPHCQKTMRHRCSSANKRCASGATQKGGCTKCRPKEVPSIRCIYKTLSRNLTRPKPAIYKAKYELILCCKKRRCQGGANEHHPHHTMPNNAPNVKRPQKYSESPARIPNYSSGQSPVRYSQPRPQSPTPAPANAYQNRFRPAPDHYPNRMTAPSPAGVSSGHQSSRLAAPSPARALSDHHSGRRAAPLPAQRRNHSEHGATTSGRDPRLAPMSGRNSPTVSTTGRDHRLASTSGRRDSARTPQLVPPMAPPMAPPMGPPMAPPMAPQMPPQMAPQMAPQLDPQLASQFASSPHPQEEHSSKSNGGENPRSSKHRHRSHKDKSHRKENKEQDQQQHPQAYQQEELHSPSQLEDRSRELAPGHRANPSPPGNQTQRLSNYMGAEINPYYRGTFLNTRSRGGYRSSVHSGSIQTSMQEVSVPRRRKFSAMSLMPPRWTGLGQLQSWVFGEPYMGNNTSRASCWTWREIFGRRRKRHQHRPQGANQ